MVWFRFICVLLLGSAKANDVIDLSHQWEVTAIHGPSQVGIVQSLAVDLNDDGWMDVVSASIDDGHIRAYLNPQVFPNPSDLNFTERIIDDDILGVYRLIQTDINEDGLIDFIATSIDSHEIVLYRQQQSGEFIKSVIATDIILPTDVIVMDANGDGWLDVISSSFHNNTLYLHKQNASGNFSIETLVHDVVGPRKMTEADFNNDNKPDFALASSGDDSIRLFVNVDFNTWQVSVISNQALGTRFVNACDINLDGWVDLVASHTNGHVLGILTNMGNGTFFEKVIDDQAIGIQATLCQDLDGDDTPDITAIHSNTSNIYTYLSSSHFSRHLTAYNRDGYISLDAADFTNQNQNQILTQTHFQQRNLIYQPAQTNMEKIIWQDFPDGAYHVDHGDLNGDGETDVVYAAFRENRVYWAEKSSDQYIVHTLHVGIDGPQSVSLGDIDHDGDVDVVVAGAWDDSIWLHRNSGSGQFHTELLFDMANNAARTKIIDVNGDGHNDVVFTSTLDDSIRWMDMSVSPPLVHLISNQMDGALSFDVGDVDNDGDVDIAVGNFFGNNVTIIINQNGVFQTISFHNNKEKPTGVVISDFDNDLKNEVLFSTTPDGNVWLLKSNGSLMDEKLINGLGESISAMGLLKIGLTEHQELLVLSKDSGDLLLIRQIEHDVFDTMVLFTELIQNRYVNPLNETLWKRTLLVANNIRNHIKKMVHSERIALNGFEPPGQKR